MEFDKKLALLWQTVKKAHSLKSLKTGKRVYDLYGIHGLKTAIKNKAAGQHILHGLEEPAALPKEERENEIGNAILEAQQGELSWEEMQEALRGLVYRPLISVVMPVYNPPLQWLKKAVESLQKQVYPHWELVAANDGSTELEGICWLEDAMRHDRRIKLCHAEKNGGISRASNLSLSHAEGDYIALMDQDDELPEDAFFWMAKAMNEEAGIDFLYSDECKIDEADPPRKFEFLCKPDWSPYLMINNMFSGHLTLYRTELLREQGGFDPAFDFGQDYELAVRMGEAAEKIVHVPRILYYWRTLPTSTASGGKPYSNAINRAVPHAWLARKGIPSNVRKHGHYNYPRLPGIGKKASILMAPVAMEGLHQFLQELVDDTSYPDYEILVVLAKESSETLKKQFPYASAIRVLESGHRDILARMEEGVGAAEGEYIVFLQEGCTPGNPLWLYDLVNALELPGVGAVSPAVLDKDFRIQWAGSGSGFSNGWSLVGTPYIMRDYFHDTDSYLLSSQVMRECLVLCRHCMALRKEDFLAAGGVDFSMSPYVFHEDLGFRVRERLGKSCLYNPMALLVCKADREPMGGGYLGCLFRWQEWYSGDPFFSDEMRQQASLTTDSSPVRFFGHHSKNTVMQGKKKILVITHELTRTGAPVVVMDAVRILKEAGYFVFVASPFDGDLRSEYGEMGIPVLVDHRLAWGRFQPEEASLFKEQWYMDYLVRDFDLVLINTIVGHNLIRRYEDLRSPVIWWIHEGTFSLELAKQYLPEHVQPNVHVMCVGKYSQDVLKKYQVSYPTESLIYGVDDIPQPDRLPERRDTGRMRFLLVGTIDDRKGQDIVFKAFRCLEKEIMDQAEFLFIGAESFGNVYQEIMKEIDKYDNVTIRPPVDRGTLLKIYQEADCLICSSRDDPMPVVITEMLLLSGLVLCSTGTGTTRYLEDGVSGFVFESENHEMLAEKIRYLVEHRRDPGMDEIRRNARRIYEEHFSMDRFRKVFLGRVSELVE